MIEQQQPATALDALPSGYRVRCDPHAPDGEPSFYFVVEGYGDGYDLAYWTAEEAAAAAIAHHQSDQV